MAHFDRAIPPGGEGKVTLKLNLKGFQGAVRKTATIFSNDPQNPRLSLTLEGIVKTLIEIRPMAAVSFRGSSDQVQESTLDIVSTSDSAFHIEKIESNLDDKIGYQMETVAEGKQYRLKVFNLLKQGGYNGYIKAYTDLKEKPELMVRVAGYIEGAVSVKPQTVLVGKLAPQQPVRIGKIIVKSSRDKQFKVTKLTYDEHLIQVSQQAIGNEQGISIEITPKMANIPTAGQQTVLTIETDVNPSEKYDVQVLVRNSGGLPAPASVPKAGGSAQDQSAPVSQTPQSNPAETGTSTSPVGGPNSAEQSRQ